MRERRRLGPDQAITVAPTGQQVTAMVQGRRAVPELGAARGREGSQHDGPTAGVG
jgi:hypothetical protein